MVRAADATILSDADLQGFCAAAREAGRRLVLTNGCFDVLHAGHAGFLRAAAAFGDVLLVGLNDDGSVRALKGADRPVLPIDDRVTLVGAVRWVDAVVPFGELHADQLIERARPHVYVKGADYDPSQGGHALPEAETLRRLEIAVRFVPLMEGRSSTSIIAGARRQP